MSSPKESRRNDSGDGEYLDAVLSALLASRLSRSELFAHYDQRMVLVNINSILLGDISQMQQQALKEFRFKDSVAEEMRISNQFFDRKNMFKAL